MHLRYFLAHGFSEDVGQTMVRAKRNSSLNQYSVYWRRWQDYCAQRSIDPHQATVNQGLEFLQYLKINFDLQYSALHTARCALSGVIVMDDHTTFCSNKFVSLYMKGIYNERTPQSRYMKLWDPNIVLDLLETWYPAGKLPLRKLTLKVTMLLLLTSGQRIDTISKLDLADIEVNSSEYVLTITQPIKQSRLGYRVPQIKLKAYPDNKRLCIHRYLTAYLKRTLPLRGDCTSLFLTFQRPYHSPSE
jgi:hypothetical protein